MTQINLLSIGQWVKKNWLLILAVFIILHLLTCNGNSDNSAVIAYRNKENVQLQKKVDSLFRINKNKEKQIAEYKKNVQSYEKKVLDLNSKIAQLKKDGEKKIAKLDKNSLKDWEKFYEERTNQNIERTETTLNFTREPLVAIGKELVAGDIARAELKITATVITEKDKIISEKDKIITAEVEKNVNLQQAIDSKDLIQNNLQKNISDLQSDLNKAKKPKLKTIVVSAILGGIAGAILAK